MGISYQDTLPDMLSQLSGSFFDGNSLATSADRFGIKFYKYSSPIYNKNF